MTVVFPNDWRKMKVARRLEEYLDAKMTEQRMVPPMKILLSQIDPPAWNSRLPKTGKDEEKKIASLGESLKSEGQIAPIEVELSNGIDGAGPTSPEARFELVIGSRRVAAARLIGWTEIEANVHENRSDAERIIRNITENEQREQLTSFEQAQACLKLRELALTQEAVGEKLGYSRSKVTNLTRAFTGLPEPLLQAWRDGDEVMTDTFRQHLMSKECPTAATKLRIYAERKAEIASLGERKRAVKGSKTNGKGSTSGGYPFSQKAARVVFEFVKTKKCPAKIGEAKVDKDWVITLLDYLVGGRKTPPNGIEKPQPKPDMDE